MRTAYTLPCVLLLIVSIIGLAACADHSRQSEDISQPASGGFFGLHQWELQQGRSAGVYGSGGMISTTDRIAAEVGIEMLRRGGNAIDAAVAVQFALAVVNPEAGNIGGGGFMLLRMADGATAALDFREKAPLKATRDMYVTGDGAAAKAGIIGALAAGVPGSVAGMWEAHQRFGLRPWAELLQPAANLAEGIVVHDRLARSLQSHESVLRKNAEASNAFLVNGQALRVGDRLEQKRLAETLLRIKRYGKDGFYRGRTAELIVSEMRRGNGIISLDDLARYRAVWRKPVAFRYRDHTVITMPPPSSGGATMAEILNILEGYDIRSMGYHSAEHIHYWTEAVKRAFADRNAYLADPDFAEQPTDRMISDAYASERRKRIRAGSPTPSEQIRPGLGPTDAADPAISPRQQHTTHYSIVDKQGNAVAVTTTLNSLYGSGVMVKGAGFLLNNEMDDFTTDPGKPNQFGLVQGNRNAIAPEKRMLSSMSPTIMLGPAGDLELVTGSPGGPTIITTVVQLISDIVDFEMNLFQATVAPRLHHQQLPDVLHYETGGVRPEVLARLNALGYKTEAWPMFQGETQSIMRLPDGRLYGMADPRGGGAALSDAVMKGSFR
ncbi:gamma-glutamyltransferase [Methylomonas sp. MgM2]